MENYNSSGNFDYPDNMSDELFNNTGAKEFVEEFSGRRIVVRETMNGQYLNIHAGTNPLETRCFSLTIDTEERGAILQEVTSDVDCFADEISHTPDIIKVAVRLARNRYKSKYLQLTDVSTIFCPYAVQLANLSFVTTGKTWYQHHILGLRPLNVSNRNRFKQWKAQLQALSWSELESRLPVIIPRSEYSFINSRDKGSAMRVLNRLNKSRRFCHLFEHMDELLSAIGIGSLYNWVWIKFFNRRSYTRRGRYKKLKTVRRTHGSPSTL